MILKYNNIKMVCLGGSLMGLIAYGAQDVYLSGFDFCNNCLLCKLRSILSSENVDKNELINILKSEKGLDVNFLCDTSSSYSNYYFKNIINYIDDIESVCNICLEISLFKKLYNLFDKCIKCKNINFDYKYLSKKFKNISSPYFLSKIEENGFYLPESEINDLFNIFIKNIYFNKEINKEINKNNKYYLNKNVYCNQKNISDWNFCNLIKLGYYKSLDINYYIIKFINNCQYKRVYKLIDYINFNYTNLEIYKKIDVIYNKYIKQYNNCKNILTKYLNTDNESQSVVILNQLCDDLNYFCDRNNNLHFFDYLDSHYYFDKNNFTKKEISIYFEKKYFDKNLDLCKSKIKNKFNNYFISKSINKEYLKKINVINNDVLNIIQSYY